MMSTAQQIREKIYRIAASIGYTETITYPDNDSQVAMRCLERIAVELSYLPMVRSHRDQADRKVVYLERRLQQEYQDEMDLRSKIDRLQAECDHARREWYAWMKLAVGQGRSLGMEHAPSLEDAATALKEGT